MATTTSTPTTTGFNWKSLIPVLESAGNISLLLIPGGAAFAPLAASLENAINPLLSAVSKGNSATTEILAAYAAEIGILEALKANTKLDPATLTKVEEYSISVHNGLEAYVSAGSGYDASLYVPVTPIA